ncbi:hypothetical protein C6Q12_01440 [Burkholderia multivorans]|nr:hypothetical protein C6Q12_01440 [Burkholderia multivorans]
MVSTGAHKQSLLFTARNRHRDSTKNRACKAKVRRDANRISPIARYLVCDNSARMAPRVP